jgi:hypothetical protein
VPRSEKERESRRAYEHAKKERCMEGEREGRGEREAEGAERERERKGPMFDCKTHTRFHSRLVTFIVVPRTVIPVPSLCVYVFIRRD